MRFAAYGERLPENCFSLNVVQYMTFWAS